ncbi:hypothetical protein RIF29_28660 [Crotalaria pallida]|uniref:DUF223 domain-containing protein n=1 Tax=Crotalaria pallida TaxID=3830 RepID=A0AAN9EDJ5_CROPI
MGVKAKIECTLFGDFVGQVKSFFSDGNRVSPMIVLQYAKVKLYKGKVVVQNTLYASRLLINPDVPEVVDIKRRLSSFGVIVDAMCDSFGGKTHTSIEDEFLKLYPKKTIAELMENSEATDDLEFPSDLKSIVGRRMLFKVSNTYSSSDHDTCVFKVRGLCDDPNIIAMYDLEGADNAPLDGISVACSAPVVDLSLDVIVNSAQDSDGFTTPVMNKRKTEYSLGEVPYNFANGKKKSSKLSKK